MNIKEKLTKKQLNQLESVLIEQLPLHYKNKTVNIFIGELAEEYGISKTTLFRKIAKPLVVKYKLKPSAKRKQKSNSKRIVLSQEEERLLVKEFLDRNWQSKSDFFKHLSQNNILGSRLPSKSTVYRILERHKACNQELSKKDRIARKNRALSLYKEGRSCDSIANALNISQQTIKVYLREFGLSFNRNPSVDFQIKVLDYYYERGTAAVIEKYGIPQSTQVRWRKKFGWPARYNSEKSRIYSLDQTFFEKIDTENKAYTLGILGTDGNVSLNVISLELKREDKELLEQVSLALGSNKPIMDTIHFDKRRNVYTKGAKAAFISKNLVNQLKRFDIKENKSLTLDINMDLIPDNLKRHLWRGAIDGDGSLFFNKGLNTPVIDYYGTLSMVERFKYFIQRKLSISLGGPWKHQSVYRVGCQTKSDTLKIVNLLYANSKIYLKRKRDIAGEWCKRMQ